VAAPRRRPFSPPPPPPPARARSRWASAFPGRVGGSPPAACCLKCAAEGDAPSARACRAAQCPSSTCPGPGGGTAPCPARHTSLCGDRGVCVSARARHRWREAGQCLFRVPFSPLCQVWGVCEGEPCDEKRLVRLSLYHLSWGKEGERGPLPHAEGEERRRERDEREREEERVMVSWPSASLLTRSVPVNFSGPAGRSTPNDPRISPMLPFILARPGGGSVGAQPRCVVAVFFHMRAASASASAAPSLRPPPAHALASHRTLPP